MNKRLEKVLTIMFFIITAMLIFMPAAHCALTFPNINIGMKTANTPQEFSQGIQIMIWLTILTLAPSIFIMTTAFIRIIIVLAIARQAIGVATLPPSQVLTGLALILTFFIMSPTINKINTTALQPYMKNQITQQAALNRAIIPARDFMFKQTDEKNLALFARMAKIKDLKTPDDVPTYILIPSFILSELNTAFKIGFVIFLPFLVIDIVVSSILVAMGMLFLPPTTIALPFKLVLFVMVDGWYLIVKSLVEGFVT
ncbi:MAG: flagellar type III secretion system pore protein FliP [Candidatus Gastranaerophilales bacterium]|nr:flagellar type III secretion system pore protein FliP [Candidatus Gastranaerophilales bacterium]